MDALGIQKAVITTQETSELALVVINEALAARHTRANCAFNFLQTPTSYLSPWEPLQVLEQYECVSKAFARFVSAEAKQ